ncbi:uncharacterized protein LOC102364872 isoform X2 [Latimeria chalumnae]|uniref:uncharacterized protein LOC102364872 isoform X2 n=1 Tax=Latimeria chalumnae TaxID=7897 RepID=UPI00313C57F7
MATRRNASPRRSCEPSGEKTSSKEQGQSYEILLAIRNATHFSLQAEMADSTDDRAVIPVTVRVTEQQELGISPAVQVGHQLAIIGDEINKRYNRESLGWLAFLTPTTELGHWLLRRNPPRSQEHPF